MTSKAISLEEDFSTKLVNSEDGIQSFQDLILSFYKSYGRSLPWRKTQDPYKILVSEIMLQQTQVSRVIEKYEEWLKLFPNVFALEKATVNEVLKAWSGLGYNRRALYLKQACTDIVEKYNGVFPKDSGVLEGLSGIGPYTSKAVATFAFEKKEIFIETNIRRAVIFHFFQDAEKVNDKELFPILAKALYDKDVRTWYWALMDYGSELKRFVQNPNKKSAHYVKQSPFENSIRKERGKIIRLLLSDKSFHIENIVIKDTEEKVRFYKALDTLVKENIVASENGIYSIKEK